MDAQQAHKTFAADCFNRCWELIEKQDRSVREDEQMLRLSEVSMWHWQQVKGHTQQNLSIGYWQLARVYALVEDIPRALYYARQCISIGESAQLETFYVAYSYEAKARALMAKGDPSFHKALRRAYQLARQVDQEDDQEMLLGDLRDLAPEP